MRRYRLRENIHNMGDVSIESGSLDNDVTVYQSPLPDGHYDALIHIEAPTDDDWTSDEAHGGFKASARWYVYRTNLPKEPAPDWVDVDAIKESMDIDKDLAHMFSSAVDGDRAFAWQMVAEYYGWEELDYYPLVMTYADAQRYIRRHLVTYARQS